MDCAQSRRKAKPRGRWVLGAVATGPFQREQEVVGLALLMRHDLAEEVSQPAARPRFPPLAIVGFVLRELGLVSFIGPVIVAVGVGHGATLAKFLQEHATDA